ncbi:MAG: flagellar basal body P-ring protein FlgI, partial [Candidatus Omnitrophica bacterium]|nr:flagellar basal body P-ring protein FlgI [Candidatus Omnitrophota bacterium]
MKKKVKILLPIFSLLVAASWIAPSFAAQVRIKDVAKVEFQRGNPLTGYGLVVGLNGTGDDSSQDATAKFIQTSLNLLSTTGKGLPFDPRTAEPANSAVVVITADLPPYARAGSRVDVTVNTVFDCESLEGGTLIPAPLRGLDGRVYAVADGPITIGGFSAGGGGGGRTQQNHPTVGTISEGAYLEANTNLLRQADRQRLNTGKVNFVLKNPDFTEALEIQNAINHFFPLVQKPAVALDPGTVEISLTPLMARYEYDSPLELIGRIEQVEIHTDVSAKVIVSERTGVVIAGADARLSAVDIVHGSLRIVVTPAEEGEIVQEGVAYIDETGGNIRPTEIRRSGGRAEQTTVTQQD